MVSFPSSFMRAIPVLFSFVWVLLQPSQPLSFYWFSLFPLWLWFSLNLPCGCSFSLAPPLLGAPALFLPAAPFSCVYLAVLLSPASPSPSLLSAAVCYPLRCCACRSPLLVAYLHSPLVRGAVPCATFSFFTSPFLFHLCFLWRGCSFFLCLLIDWDSLWSLCFSPSLVRLPITAAAFFTRLLFQRSLYL